MAVHARRLRSDEQRLLQLLLTEQQSLLPHDFDTLAVEDMKDGGMGGIRVVGSSDPQRFGRTVAQAECLDADGVVVSISVNVDQHDRFFELDIWKVDFSPLQQYPSPDHVKVR